MGRARLPGNEVRDDNCGGRTWISTKIVVFVEGERSTYPILSGPRFIGAIAGLAMQLGARGGCGMGADFRRYFTISRVGFWNKGGYMRLKRRGG
jgi:hypothetical protein